MIPRWQYIVFNLTLLLAWCSAKPQARVLTLFDDIKQADQVTQFLQDVEGLGFEIEKRSTTDPELHLRSWDDWRYEKLIIFSSGSKGGISSAVARGIHAFQHEFLLCIASSNKS